MLDGKTIAALVPMKGHSERVPGKNVRLFNGAPLFHHILRSLHNASTVDAVYVNTDSDYIAEEAPRVSGKVSVIKRPEALCGDFVSMNRIIEHDLELIESDVFLQTHCTNPLLRPEVVTGALERFLADRAYDSLFSVNAYQSRFYDHEGNPVNHDPENLIRTQDLPPLYEENSCLYIFTKDSFSIRRRRIGVKPCLYPIPRLDSIDIDDEYTFRLAEVLAAYGRQLELNGEL